MKIFNFKENDLICFYLNPNTLSFIYKYYIIYVFIIHCGETDHIISFVSHRQTNQISPNILMLNHKNSIAKRYGIDTF